MEQIDALLIPLNTPVKQAWRQMNENGYKILFVVDAQRVLHGSVTDGDVRRWILQDGSLMAMIEDVMCRTPVVAHEHESLDVIKRNMLQQRIECVPVVDAKRVLQRVVFWDELFHSDTVAATPAPLNLPVVIMAGGRGERLHPFTKIIPKPLFPIGEKPMIEVIMENFAKFGMHTFHVSLNYKSGMIRAYFQECQHGFDLHFFEEAAPSGTIGSLSMLANTIKTPFFVSNADILVQANYADVYEFHRRHGNVITLVCSMKHFHIPYGVVDITSGGVLRSIREKPEIDHLVLTGVYLLEPEVMRFIPPDQPFDMTHMIAKLQQEDQKVGVYPVAEWDWMDIGELESYQKLLGRFHAV